jgi:tetratricopeptide (TPR) repeat protein
LASPVFGAGQRDPDLAKADNLIKEKKHDEAIRVLTDYVRRNPDHFDDAQKRLRKIYQIRGDFNSTADELISTLLNNPENQEKIYDLTVRLKTLEDEASPLLASFISRTHEVARFNVLRNRLRNILETGRAQLDRGECEAALLTYASGMSLMREEFFDAGYGASVENSVRRETERVNSVIGVFRQVSTDMGPPAAEVARAAASGSTNITAETGRLTQAMDRFIAAKQELYTAVRTFDSILDRLRRSDPEMADRNHLSFLSILINGRQGESIQEGMLGAFETYWRNSINPILSAITQNAQAANSTGLAAFNAGQYSNSVTLLQRTGNIAGLSNLFFQKRLALNENSNTQLVEMPGITIAKDDIPAYVTLRALSESSTHLIQAANLSVRVETLTGSGQSSFTLWQEGKVDAVTAINNELRARNNAAGVKGEIDAVILSASRADNQLKNYYTTPYLAEAIGAIQKIYDDAAALERRSAYSYYFAVDTELKRGLTARTAELEKGRNFLNGQSRTRTDGSTVTELYPAEALETLTAMLAALSIDIEQGNTAIANYRNETRAIQTDKEIPALLSNSEKSISGLNTLRGQATSLRNTANSRTTQAEAFRQEGERLLREAQASYRSQNFDTARDRLQRAAERFNSSLEVQESASLRQSWDTQLFNLGQAINAAENEMIIAEVRNLVNTARASYFEGNFQQAEDRLVRARSRWRTTNADENEEILYWLGIVRGAMSARSGRTIPPTAPLYPEMSQLLSKARMNYEEGVRLISTGNRTGGLAKFAEARQQTRDVRLIFPVNQDAGMLELRMEQYTDPAAFNASFEQRIRTAIAGTKQRSIESFAELQNLAEINPRYSGLRAILTQAEIDMGYRPPPPDPRALARSRELSSAANRILEANNTTLFEVALTQVNEAIALNPENAEAMRVKDRLLNRMSVPGAIVLSSDDELEYQRAVRELQAGNNLVAFAVVEKLMQNPRNRNITKLIELQRRIQSVL